MAKNLLIVESPAKAKTINKYLGKDFAVLASYGHVRDLTPKDGAVDPDNNFAMSYELIEKNERHVEAIVKATKAADALYLATDLDREGEAISWHIYEILKAKRLLKDKAVHRVTFSEITPKAVKAAVDHPRAISDDMVNAQQARRALDYLVGFNLSPLLWRKVRRGLSAGRVQSPALRMIVEREEEIERFEKREYWTIESDLNHALTPFSAKLHTYDGRKLEQFDLNTELLAFAARERIVREANGALTVADIQSKERKRRPAAPFITSTLQQEAARKLGFSTRKTMTVAQGLYEGVALDDGTQGLITYMRTDSVSLSQDALTELREVIRREYGADKLPEAAVYYKTKSKNAQEAHEAIRPTSSLRTPKSVERFLDRDQARLYELIWQRTVASQMIPATMHVTTVDLAAGAGNTLRATGSTIVDPGFLLVYREDVDDKDPNADDENRKLPQLRVGEKVPLAQVRAEQHFTEPPPRFSEASLVKALEEHGIGRPSTYASIISVLLAREYVMLDNKRFHPSDVGRVVAKFLSNHFTQYVDYGYTARLEDDLDAVSRGERDWIPLLHEFWGGFKKELDDKQDISREEVANARVLGDDPKTGKPVSVRLGRYGPFVQIGTKDDADKPLFASLKPGQKMDSIGLDDALALFGLPRMLGQTADGEEVSTNIGRFGPFVKYGKAYASLKAGDDPYTLTLERALEVIAEKALAAANRTIAKFDGTPIQILNGRYGPYVTDGERNANVPKDREPASLSLLECQQLLDEKGKAPKGKRGFGKKAPAKAKAAPAEKPARAKTAAPRKVASAANKRTTKSPNKRAAAPKRSSVAAG
jgi:DNA topoisomerase I